MVILRDKIRFYEGNLNFGMPTYICHRSFSKCILDVV